MELNKAYWKNVLQLPGTPFTLRGHSRSTEMTGYIIPELDMYLDAGIRGCYTCNTILITHGHGDHIQSLNGILKSQRENRSVRTSSQVQIYCPKKAAPYLERYIMAYLHLNSCNKYQKIHKSCDIHPVDTNQEINVTIKNRQYLIRVFKCIHTVPTVGFGVAEMRKRIKPEYASSSKAEIVATKKSGEEISVLTEVPLFCFLGDTTDKVFSLHPII